MDNTWVDWLNVLLLQNTMHNELFDYHCNAVVILLAKKCIFVSIPGSKVDCSKVTRPEAKNIVLSTSLMTSVLFRKHIGPLEKEISNVPPNMVK